MKRFLCVSRDSSRLLRRSRGALDLPRRIKAFEQSTAHHAGMCRLLCMGLFSRFLL
jgi:hypothetical protein